jgi:hypothetical protein
MLMGALLSRVPPAWRALYAEGEDYVARNSPDQLYSLLDEGLGDVLQDEGLGDGHFDFDRGVGISTIVMCARTKYRAGFRQWEKALTEADGAFDAAACSPRLRSLLWLITDALPTSFIVSLLRNEAGGPSSSHLLELVRREDAHDILLRHVAPQVLRAFFTDPRTRGCVRSAKSLKLLDAVAEITGPSRLARRYVHDWATSGEARRVEWALMHGASPFLRNRKKKTIDAVTQRREIKTLVRCAQTTYREVRLVGLRSGLPDGPCLLIFAMLGLFGATDPVLRDRPLLNKTHKRELDVPACYEMKKKPRK